MDVRAHNFQTPAGDIVRITTTRVGNLVETRVSTDDHDDWVEHYLTPSERTFDDVHAATVAAWRKVYDVPEGEAHRG